MQADYADLKEAVEAAGFFTTFMPICEVGDRIVCASLRYTEGPRRGALGGNSFWVAKRGADWFVATWCPAIYRVCKVERLSSSSASCLFDARTTRERMAELTSWFVRSSASSRSRMQSSRSLGKVERCPLTRSAIQNILPMATKRNSLVRADDAGDFATGAGPVREGPSGCKGAVRTLASNRRQGAEWSDFGSVRQTFPAADLFEKCVIFNIGGNKYRLIAAIHYRKKLIEGQDGRRTGIYPDHIDSCGIRQGSVERRLHVSSSR